VIVVVGSVNPVKIAGARSAMRSMKPDALWGSALIDVRGKAAPSGVSEQPMSLEETFQGAEHRALSIADQSNQSLWLGIESGVFEQGGHMFDVTACVMVSRSYGGARGLSSAWILPADVADLLRAGAGATTIDDALVATGRTAEARMGYREGGAVGLLSQGLVTREQLTEQAVAAALVGLLQNPEIQRRGR
jgi:inosine/xanthosine triphosphatase